MPKKYFQKEGIKMSIFSIIDPGLTFNGGRTRRNRTEGIILHHPDSQWTVSQVHNFHRSLGWLGIGYNFYIHKDGTIYSGRGLEFVGAHTTNFNNKTIGISCQGQYDSVDTSMPDEQYNALVWLIMYCRERYGNSLYIKGHNDASTTACPGRFFPLSEVRTLVFRQEAATDQNGSPYGTSTATVRNGSRGMVVKRCQWYLNRAIDAGLDIDGIAGPKTVAAIRAFQTKHGLAVDGICGPLTWAKLEEVVKAQNEENSSDIICSAEVKEAISILHEAGVINTPSYWEENFNKLKYLDLLLVKLARVDQEDNVTFNIVTVNQAVERLVSVGAVDTPEYWLNNYGKIEYLDELLIKAAERIGN